jgi:hypothetical protein
VALAAVVLPISARGRASQRVSQRLQRRVHDDPAVGTRVAHDHRRADEVVQGNLVRRRPRMGFGHADDHLVLAERRLG